MSQTLLLPLTQWTKNHITAIIQATNQTDLDSAIDAFLSQDATIVVNGVEVSRAEFVDQVQAEKFNEAGATVSFAGSVEVPADNERPLAVSPDSDVRAMIKLFLQGGSVGLFYNAIISKKIRIRGAPARSEVTASVNVV